MGDLPASCAIKKWRQDGGLGYTRLTEGVTRSVLVHISKHTWLPNCNCVIAPENGFQTHPMYSKLAILRLAI